MKLKIKVRQSQKKKVTDKRRPTVINFAEKIRFEIKIFSAVKFIHLLSTLLEFIHPFFILCPMFPY